MIKIMSSFFKHCNLQISLKIENWNAKNLFFSWQTSLYLHCLWPQDNYLRSLCFSEERIVGKWRVKHEKKQDLIGENSWGENNHGWGLESTLRPVDWLKLWEEKYFSSGSVFHDWDSFLPFFPLLLISLWLSYSAGSMVVKNKESAARQPQMMFKIQCVLAV